MKEQIDKYDNSFNFIRLLAAFQVFCGHAFAHLNVAMPIELQFVMRIFPGVPIFFGLSGYLLWNSLDKSSDFKQFALKRILRLYPEMWGGELLNMIIILLLYRESIDWIQFVFFKIGQATLLQFWTPDCLREYGCGTPNGSLWTVTVMVQCYVLLWGSHKILHNRRLKRWFAAIFIFVILSVICEKKESFLSEIACKIIDVTFVPYLYIFLIGAFMMEYYDILIPYLKKYWLALLVVAEIVNMLKIDVGRYGSVHTAFILATLIGFSYKFNKIKINKDISYGFYIYHMVVINAMIELGYIKYPWFVLTAAVITLILALLSYFTIGGFSRKLRLQRV